ncbi:Uncharacterised protein [Mycobacteroides abscessus subsp. abscessus]|nr:Uncharacterised protein [Mycobacteroides abscessus subsp. abscessus]
MRIPAPRSCAATFTSTDLASCPRGTQNTSQRPLSPTVTPSARSARTVLSTPSPKPIPDNDCPPSCAISPS